MKQYFLIFIALSSLLVSCEKENEETKRLGALEGIIQNEFGQPIDGALIEIENSSTLSNSYGKYSFSKLPVKEYSVSASKEAFLSKVQKITIIENETAGLDFIMLAGDPFMNISDSILDVNASNGSIRIKVLSNAGWYVNNSSSWLVCSRENGEGNETVRINYSANEDYFNRTDTIFFISGSIKNSLIVNQSASLKLIKYEGIIGNGEREIKDSVYLLFNKPIHIESIKSNWEYCLSEINYSHTDNNHGVMFSYSCAELGGNYPFTISVTDIDGNTFYQSINIPFFTSKLDFEGLMTDYLLINNEKEILISAFLPSRLIKYSIELDSVIQIYDLSEHIAPIKISYNPYNSKIYIMGSNPDEGARGAYINRPDIYTLDLQTNQIIKAITIELDEDDYSQSSANIPYNLGFTQSGYGIVLLRSNGSSALRWKLIDCSNDSIYKYPYNDDTIDEYGIFNNLHMNYNYTKLYLTQPYGSCNYGIFDGTSQEISILRPTSITRGVFISPNRKIDKFYAGQLYDQFIIDLNGNMSQISYLDNRSDGSADFSYKKNEENIIYFCDKDNFRLMDYNNASTLMSCDIIYGLNKFTSTLDGNYAIAFKQNSDISSSLYIFNTDCFYRHLK